MVPGDGRAAGAEGTGRSDRWVATGGILGAIVASSCCVVPLLLVTIGVSGAWIGNLTALEPYRFYFIAVAAAFIGVGFWRVYFRPAAACAEGSYCSPKSSRITRIVLWTAALLLAVDLTMTWWAPLFY